MASQRQAKQDGAWKDQKDEEYERICQGNMWVETDTAKDSGGYP